MSDLLRRLETWRHEAAWGRGWLAKSAPQVVQQLESDILEQLNAKAEAGGHGEDLSAMSIDEIRDRLFGQQL